MPATNDVSIHAACETLPSAISSAISGIAANIASIEKATVANIIAIRAMNSVRPITWLGAIGIVASRFDAIARHCDV